MASCRAGCRVLLIERVLLLGNHWDCRLLLHWDWLGGCSGDKFTSGWGGSRIVRCWMLILTSRLGFTDGRWLGCIRNQVVVR